MKTLKAVQKYLKSKISGRTNYAIPSLWIVDGYDGKMKEKNGEVFVDPYEFFSKTIEKIVSNGKQKTDYSKPLSFIKKENSSSWIKDSVIYGSLPRTTTTFNHKGFGCFEEEDILGYKESGTFLKMITLLPYLKNIGVNVLYMLPISKMSTAFKKGEISSPYSVKNPMKLDESYHDPLLDSFDVEEEFKALVEAAHILGIRVILDFIPRTAARDSDLIKEHPDWFYWISVDELSSYGPPEVSELPFKIPDSEDLEIIYSNPKVKEHLKKFSPSPDKVDPKKWEKVKKMEGDVLTNIVKEFGLITPPGFSDWVNDPQPTWDDVTFVRLFLDHPAQSQKYLPKNQVPYVLFDVIKASKFPGNEPNIELWNYLSDIVPHYQKEFGIDGARIDMGHALPKELQNMIISKARDVDSAFVFIAEELEMKNDEKAKTEGYDCILGNSWYAAARPREFYEFIESTIVNLKVPYIASCETPDTPRIVARENGEKLKYLAPVLLYLSPNGVPYINNGQEIDEIQPMNLGLDNTVWGKTLLNPSDQFFGKLGFFDHYQLHWKEAKRDTYNFLKRLIELRNEIKEYIYEGEFKYVYLNYQDGLTANYSYWKGEKGVIVLGNLNLAQQRYVEVDLINTANVRAKEVQLWTRFGKRKLITGNDTKIGVDLEPGGFAVLLVNIL